MAKSTLDNVLKAVLSIANAEQNSAYPPHIYQAHINIVTAYMLNRFAEVYPDKQDVFLPFIQQKKIAVTDGHVKFPDNFRNLLGSPSINVRPDGKDCGGPVIIDTAAEFKVAQLKAGCQTYPVFIIDKSEWDSRVTSESAAPTYKKPIGYYAGEKRIKLCPYDLATVEITYLRQEKEYRYGYIMQPDDTYIFNINTSVELEWGDAAFDYLVRGCYALYAAYSKDQTSIQYSQILNKEGIL